jgi:hypothetical protein
MTTKEFVGAELEQAYAKVMGWRVVGGLNDGGKDLATDIPAMPFVQAKSSVPLTMDFLRKSAKRRQFIPICLGDPGKPDEVLSSLKRFGAWIGHEIPGREQFSAEIQQLRRVLVGT